MRHALLGLVVALAGGFLLAQAPPTNTPAPPPTTPPAPTPPVVPAPGTTPPAPTPPAAGPATTDLFPTKKGTKWVYKAGEVEVTLQAGDTDTKTGETKLETLVQGKKVADETVRVTADGVYRTKINNSPIDPPVKILELEMKGDKLTAKPMGTKWGVASKVLQSELKGEFTIAKVEPSYDVNGQKFANAVVVEGPNFSIASTDTKVTYVFAPGKGVVKLTYAIGGNSTSLELLRYEEGK